VTGVRGGSQSVLLVWKNFAIYQIAILRICAKVNAIPTNRTSVNIIKRSSEMASISDQHRILDKEGKGFCSKPMWSGMGMPAGFCDEVAYSKKLRMLPREYSGDKVYVPALACYSHGGLNSPIETKMDGKKWCATYPNFKSIQESPIGFGDTEQEARNNLLKED